MEHLILTNEQIRSLAFIASVRTGNHRNGIVGRCRSVQLHKVMELQIITGMGFLISHEKNRRLSIERRFSHETREIRVAKIGCSCFSIDERNTSVITLPKDFLSCVEKKQDHIFGQGFSRVVTEKIAA